MDKNKFENIDDLSKQELDALLDETIETFAGYLFDIGLRLEGASSDGKFPLSTIMMKTQIAVENKYRDFTYRLTHALDEITNHFTGKCKNPRLNQ